MFESPRLVIKSGRVILEQGELCHAPFGKTLHVEPEYDIHRRDDIQRWFEDHYSIQWNNYPVDASYLGESEVIATQ